MAISPNLVRLRSGGGDGVFGMTPQTIVRTLWDARVAPAAPAPLARPSPIDVGIALAAGMIAFWGQLSLAHVFWAEGLFDYGALFQTDPDRWTPILAFGEGKPTFRHPLLQPIVYPFVSAVAHIVAAITPYAASSEDLRTAILITVAPAFGGLQAGAAYALFRVLQFPRWVAVGGCALVLCSFSQLVFAAIPESMGISGALLTCVFLLAAAAMREPRYTELRYWVPLAVLVAGITISNIVIVCIAYVAACLSNGRRLGASTVRGTALFAGVFAGLLAFLELHEALVPVHTPAAQGEASILKALRLNPFWVLQIARDYPLMLWRTLFADMPHFYDSAYFQSIGAERWHVADYVATKWSPGRLIAAGASIAVLLAGLYFWVLDRRWRWMALASAGVLAFNGALHSFWGTGWYFYSQHWLMAMVIALYGLAWRTSPIRVPAAALFACAAPVCLYLGLDMIATIAQRIDAASS